MDYENIVYYYGVILCEEKVRGKNWFFWIMVMEYCLGILKDKIINEDYDNFVKVGKIYFV